MANAAVKFTKRDLELACDQLSMLPFYPSEARGAVMHLLAKMCPHKEALDWLVMQCMTRVDRWPGPAELRGLLCTKYDAADGIDAYCNLPGFTPAEMEARHIEQHEALKAGGWEQDAEEQFKKLADGVKLKQLPPATKKAANG